MLTNDSDPAAGDTLAVVSINTTGTLGLVTHNGDGTFTYNPNGQFESLADGQTATDTFTYTISDGDGSFSTATVTITITGANDVPTLPGATFTVPENTPNGTVVGSVAGADADAGETLTMRSPAGNLGGAFAIDVATGTITVANAGVLDFEAHAVFTLTVVVTDAGTPGLTATATVTIHLTDRNDTPPVIAVGQVFTISEGEPNGFVVGMVTASDADTVGGLQGWQIVNGSGAGVFAMDAATGVITVIDSAALEFDLHPTFTLHVQVSDGVNTSAVGTVTIQLTEVADHPPVVTSGQVLTIAENSPLGTNVGVIAATDVDGPAGLGGWRIVGGSGASVFSVDAATGRVSVVDPALLNFEATSTWTLIVTVSDGVHNSAAETVTIQVANVNEAPQLQSAGTVQVRTGSVHSSMPGVLAGATDPDGDAVTAQLVQQAAHGTVTIHADGSWTYVADAGFLGSDQFSAMGTDGQLMSAPVVVLLNVQGARAAPGWQRRRPARADACRSRSAAERRWHFPSVHGWRCSGHADFPRVDARQRRGWVRTGVELRRPTDHQRAAGP